MIYCSWSVLFTIFECCHQINARWHATNFGPLLSVCLGPDSDAVEGTALALLACAHRHNQRNGEGDAAQNVELLAAADACWQAIPARYGTLKQSGRVVHLVSSMSGRISRVNHLDKIEALESVKTSMPPPLSPQVCLC